MLFTRVTAYCDWIKNMTKGEARCIGFDEELSNPTNEGYYDNKTIEVSTTTPISGNYLCDSDWIYFDKTKFCYGVRFTYSTV